MQEFPDLTDVEARATAADRLDLHFEHRDALDVERGSLSLATHLGRFRTLQVAIGEHRIRGDVLAIGPDWVHLTTALVRLEVCHMITGTGSGDGASVPATPTVPMTMLDFRQAVRQAAGRVPREVIMADGRARLLVIEWVARDFVHVLADGVAAVVPLGQFAAVFGRIDLV